MCYACFAYLIDFTIFIQLFHDMLEYFDVSWLPEGLTPQQKLWAWYLGTAIVAVPVEKLLVAFPVRPATYLSTIMARSTSA